MAEPISKLDLLDKSGEMMHRMELLCMQLQGKLCREIEKIEGTTKFRVDRWLKDEVCMGVCCALNIFMYVYVQWRVSTTMPSCHE